MKSKFLNSSSTVSKSKLIIFIFITLCAFNANSQDHKTFIVNPGQKVFDVVSVSDMYRYTNFKPGQVVFKDKQESNALMNYNLLLNEFQFINTNGDTLSIADENLVKLIKVDNDTFYYYNRGCYESITSFFSFKLVKKEIIFMASDNKIGAYNQPIQGGSASSYTRFSSGVRNTNLIVNEKIVLKKEATYYLTTQNDNVVPASKKNLENELSKYRHAIEQYLTSNHVNFKDEEDLKKLISYIKEYKL